MEKYYLKEFDTDATMIVVGEKQFRVLKDSKADFKNVRPSFEKSQKKYFDERKKLIDSGALKLVGNIYISTRDIDFKSVSEASCVFLGRSSNGQTEWKDELGMPFNSRKTYLNDLLQLTGDDLEQTKVKFNQKAPTGDDPWKIYQEDPKQINHDWLFWHEERHYFEEGQIAVCLVKMPTGYWLLTTIKRVTKRLGKTGAPNYEGFEIERYRHLFGKVVIKYSKSHPQQGVTFDKVKEKLEVIQNHCHRRMLFAHVTWMEKYDGNEKTQGGGEYGDRGIASETKYEIYNFSNNNGRCFGFVEPPQKSKNNQIKIERIDSQFDNKCEKIDGVIVVFVAKKPDESGLHMVGFYKNATVFRCLKKDITGRLIESEGKEATYNLLCDFEDAYWLPSTHRIIVGSISHIRRPTVIYPTEEMQDEVLAHIEQIQIVENESLQVKKVLSKLLIDDDIKVIFDKSKIKIGLPINVIRSHDYTPTNSSGTSHDGLKKIYSGRKAEKYFIEFLKINGFVSGKEFEDVANNKNHGCDIKFCDINIEIKNIASGGFYLSDNEIGQIEKGITCLVLVAINRGIWLLNSKSTWLKKRINEIKEIRDYCGSKYIDIDLMDIKININTEIEEEAIEISQLAYNEIKAAFIALEVYS